MTQILIAIPYDPECEHVDAWDMLMRDLRDDVPLVHTMPSYIDANPSREVIRGLDAFTFRFDAEAELASQLLESAYANCPDLIIEAV